MPTPTHHRAEAIVSGAAECDFAEMSLDAAGLGTNELRQINAKTKMAARMNWSRMKLGDPQRVARKIFEPFATTKESGTRLGLAICRRIVEAHDGSITVKNAAGAGAEFSIWLPHRAAESHKSLLEADQPKVA